MLLRKCSEIPTFPKCLLADFVFGATERFAFQRDDEYLRKCLTLVREGGIGGDRGNIDTGVCCRS